MFENAEVISSYSRADAIADGTLVDLTGATDTDGRRLIVNAGFKVPVAMTRAAYAETLEAGGSYQTDPNDPELEELKLPGCQDVIGRLWDVAYHATNLRQVNR